MYDIIKEQFKSGNALTQSRNHNAVKREFWPKFYWDLYPLAQEYYHELNPYFLFNIYRPELLKFTNVFTVRDGYINFADFILNNFSTLRDLGPELFLIHPSLAKLVPQNASDLFGTWKIVQKKQTKLEEARKVTIFGFISEQYLGDLDNLPERLKPLKNIKADAEISLYLPIRKNVFELQGKESLAIHLVMNHIKDALPGRKLKILSSEHFFDITDFKNSYIFDLALDNFIVSDNYLHYYVQSRGATVNNGSLTSAPDDSVFSLDLSLHHELHACKLPSVENHFMDLLMYKKQNPSMKSKEFIFDPNFQGTLREIFTVKS